jgi:hypothetical protein
MQLSLITGGSSSLPSCSIFLSFRWRWRRVHELQGQLCCLASAPCEKTRIHACFLSENVALSLLMLCNVVLCTWVM